MTKFNFTLKKIMKVIIGIILLIVLFGIILLAFITVGKEKALNLELNGVSLQKVDDGAYVGNYKGFRWSNTVKVTVKNHQIKDIYEIKSQVFATKETIEELKKRVLSEQTTNVDAVSGATADSKAFLKAIENALP
jgi:uncharacterized protein with FMN-binding domain